MRIERITTTSALPFDLGAVAEHLRIEPTAMPEASRLARAAAREIEAHAHIALLTQTIRLTLDAWPIDGLELPLPIAPVPADGLVTVTVDGVALPEVELGAGLRPSLRITLDELPHDLREGRWVIDYQAGFGDAASDLPPDLTHAIIDQAGALYDQRAGFLDKSGHALSPHMARIAARYRRVAL